MAETKESWRVADLIAAKAAGEELSENQLRQLVSDITNDVMDHTQMGKLLFTLFYFKKMYFLKFRIYRINRM